MSNENIINDAWPVGKRFCVALTVNEKGAAGHFMNHMKPSGNNEPLYDCDVEAIYLEDLNDVAENSAKIMQHKADDLSNFARNSVQFGSAYIKKENDALLVQDMLLSYSADAFSIADGINPETMSYGELMDYVANSLIVAGNRIKELNL